MNILNDNWIDQVTLRLCEEYPLLDFSFQDDYTEELKLILEAAYRETLKMVIKYLDDKLGYDYSGIRTEEILALNQSGEE